MKLRAPLVLQFGGRLPAACQLPEGYLLEIVSPEDTCLVCGRGLRRNRTSTHQPVGLMLGRPRVRRVQKGCPGCGWTEPQDGGYAMHVDGTCEPGTDVLFAVVAAPRSWTLQTAKMATENVGEIRQLLQACVESVGSPVAVMRDLSPTIRQAKEAVIPDVPDLICHYHFLENVGTKLCEKPHTKLTQAVRRLKTRPALATLRKDIVRWTRRGESPVSPPRMEELLAFYRRGRCLGQWLKTLLAAKNFPQQDFSTLATMLRHLSALEVVLDYLETYPQQWVGHVIPVEGHSDPLVVSRTNNLLEQRFRRPGLLETVKQWILSGIGPREAKQVA